MPNFGLSDNALQIFKSLYCFEGESISQTFRRVAKEFATTQDEEDAAFRLLSEGVWRPNTPVFFSAGTDKKMFSACFTVSLEDSMDSIYQTANVARKIFQHGAGVGIPIGNLREAAAPIFEGNPDTAPMGKSSGAVSFMKLFDAVGATTKSGGRTRRAAILCDMPVWHPDIMDFIRCKEVDGTLSNMNISVCITDEFMGALDDGVPFRLRTPYDGSDKATIDPQLVWDEIVKLSHKTADPGILFIDTINKFNPLKKIRLIEVSNPCGEQPLAPYMACNLSSINIFKFIENGQFNFVKFHDTVRMVMRLMDNLIDVMDFPDERFKTNVLKYRPVGIGIMGLSDALFELGLAYDDTDGKKFSSDVMKTLTTACLEESCALAKLHCPFDEWLEVKDDAMEVYASLTDDNKSLMADIAKYGVRNCQHTTIAPTGTTAISTDCSYGMEPCFGLVFTKNLIDGSVMKMVNPIFKKFEDAPWYSDELLEKIAKNNGSLKGLRGVPKEIREVFVVAHDIKPKDRIEMQSSLQKYCSTGVSSTVNLPKDATIEEVSELYKYAYKMGLKGITIYRDGSKQFQPINFTTLEKKETVMPSPIKPIKRPKRMVAASYQLDTGNGDMLVDVASHEGRVLQVVLNLGKSGQSLNTLLEAVGRCLSIGLQHGVPLNAYVKTLEGINSDRPIFTRLEETDKRPVQILSIPDGLAKLLKRFHIDGEDKEIDESVEKEVCAKCGANSVVKIEGCSVCIACNYSACN